MYNKLLIAISIKSILEIALLFVFIRDIPNILPIAFVFSNYTIVGILIYMLNRSRMDLVDNKIVIITLTSALLISIGLVFLYIPNIYFLIKLPLYKLFIIYGFLFIVVSALLYFALRNNILVRSLLRKVLKKFNVNIGKDD